MWKHPMGTVKWDFEPLPTREELEFYRKTHERLEQMRRMEAVFEAMISNVAVENVSITVGTCDGRQVAKWPDSY